MDGLLTKEDTKALKGIAVFLMIALHLWRFPERIAGELHYLLNIFGQSSLYYFGGFGNICVDIFFFLGGYGLYVSSRGKEIDIIKRIKLLYKSYWRVFLIFIPIAFIFFSNQPIYTVDAQISTRYNDFNFTYFVANFLGIESTYNSEWWFLKSYIIAIFSYPFIKGIIENRNASKNIFLIICFSIINSRVLPFVGNVDWLGTLNTNRLYSDLIRQVAPFISSFWMGIACAKEGLLNKIDKMLHDNGVCGVIIDLCCIFAISFMRQISVGPDFGFLYVPFLIIFLVDIFERLNWVKVLFFKIGNQSTNMWLIHSFYCYYFYYTSKLIVSLRWAVPALIFLVMLSFVSGIVIDFIWKHLENILKHFLRAGKGAILP